MAYLRVIGSELHHPADITPGATLVMPYLRQMHRYQRYLDGHLEPLFDWGARGGANANKLTGMRYYIDSQPVDDPTNPNGLGANRYAALWRINFFRAAVDYLEAAVFERSPTVIDGDETLQQQWQDDSPPLLKAARRATRWYGAKGDGVLKVEDRFSPGGVVPTPLAVDPEFWIPLVDPIYRDLQVGDALLQRWHEGPRQHTDIYNRITAEILVTPEQALQSDGRIPSEVNTTADFAWSGGIEGNIGAITRGFRPGRLRGIWHFGNSDSMFAEMESNVLEAILNLSTARASLMRHPFPIVLLPPDIDQFNRDRDGNFTIDLFDPIVLASLTNVQGASAFGYTNNPAPAMAAAFLEVLDQAIDNLAFVAKMPREAFGLGMMANESGEALTRLQQTFKTMVIDIRDELSKILPKMWEAMGGPANVKIGWEHEPFARDKDWRDEIRVDHKENRISTATAQNLLGYPIEEIATPTTTEDGDTDAP